jgi:hypothetical protein
MVHFSARQRLAAATCIVVVLAAFGLYLGSRVQSPPVLTAEQVAGSSAPVGRTVSLQGAVRSFSAGECVLVSDSGRASVKVSFREPQRIDLGAGVQVVVRGTVDAAGVVSDAEIIAPTGPSKYQGQ